MSRDTYPSSPWATGTGSRSPPSRLPTSVYRGATERTLTQREPEMGGTRHWVVVDVLSHRNDEQKIDFTLPFIGLTTLNFCLLFFNFLFVCFKQTFIVRTRLP